jgi:hypothetical protein
VNCSRLINDLRLWRERGAFYHRFCHHIAYTPAEPCLASRHRHARRIPEDDPYRAHYSES